MQRIDDMGVLRLEGELRLELAVRAGSDGIRLAREQGFGKLMIVASGLTGLGPVTVTDRLSLVRNWADAAQGRVTLALVTSPDLIDPERFGMVAATRFGLAAAVFTTEDEALAWLKELP